MARFGLGKSGLGLDFEIPGLFELVIVGDEVRFFLGMERGKRAKKQKDEGKRADFAAGGEE